MSHFTEDERTETISDRDEIFDELVADRGTLALLTDAMATQPVPLDPIVAKCVLYAATEVALHIDKLKDADIEVPPVLLDAVITGEYGEMLVVDCPYCYGPHRHNQPIGDGIRVAGCGIGPYRIIRKPAPTLPPKQKEGIPNE